MLYSDSASLLDNENDAETNLNTIEPFAHLNGEQRRKLLTRKLSANPQSPQGFRNFSTISALYVAQPRVYVDTFTLEFRPSSYYRHTYYCPTVAESMISFAVVVLVICIASYRNDKHIQEAILLKEKNSNAIVLSRKKVQFDRHVIIIPMSATALAVREWSKMKENTRKVADREALAVVKGKITTKLAQEAFLRHQHYEFGFSSDEEGEIGQPVHAMGGNAEGGASAGVETGAESGAESGNESENEHKEGSLPSPRRHKRRAYLDADLVMPFQSAPLPTLGKLADA